MPLVLVVSDPLGLTMKHPKLDDALKESKRHTVGVSSP